MGKLPKCCCAVPAIILDKTNEKLPPLRPIEMMENGVCCFACEFIIDFGRGRGGFLFYSVQGCSYCK